MKINNFIDTLWYKEYKKFESDSLYACTKTKQELKNLVSRVIGEQWTKYFDFEQVDIHSANGNDAYEIYEENGKIIIRGRNGVSMASGFNYYLKNYANVNFNPLFVSNVNMPDELPHISEKIYRETNYSVRYALNYCTYGYTMAFWGWKEYEAFLDWSAMNGVNLMLDIVGQEEVQRRFLMEYGYSDKEVKEYLPGPAYFPWFFMQNMSGFGGPLPEEWFEQRVELGRKIHDRMQVYGIHPVFQGYSGMVPKDFGQKHPDASIIDQGLWCGFSRPNMLKTHDACGKDYFAEAADVFYAKQKEVFGAITHYYSVDPFHEGGKMGDMTPDVVYHRVQEKMLENDPKAIWLLQQWQGQLTDEKLCHLANPWQVLVLDLQADKRYFNELMERHGIPWVWDMVHNFGGRMGLDGDVVRLAKEIPEKYYNSHYMVGIGTAPEAFNNGPIMFELLFDMAWEDKPVDCTQYVKKYIKSRYGSSNEHIEKAWDILLHTVYGKKTGYTQGAGESVINVRPTEEFKSASTWGHSTLEYDQLELEQALPEFIMAYEEYKDCETFIYDMTDLTKQIISNRAKLYHQEMISAYHMGDYELFDKISKEFLDLIQLQDQVLSCFPEFSLESWIDMARNVLPEADSQMKDLFEFNARALVTTWGNYENSEDCLLDYSNRQWAGLTKNYYLKRWENFVERYKDSLRTGKEPAQVNYFEMEWEWANQKASHTCESCRMPEKNLKILAQQVYDLYSQTAMGQEQNEKYSNQNYYF